MKWKAGIMSTQVRQLKYKKRQKNPPPLLPKIRKNNIESKRTAVMKKRGKKQLDVLLRTNSRIIAKDKQCGTIRLKDRLQNTY